jgi:hypothetical protein
VGLYNVVKPCVVGDLHYARPTTQPIEVDDDVAAELVEAGSLAHVREEASESSERAESAAPRRARARRHTDTEGE